MKGGCGVDFYRHEALEARTRSAKVYGNLVRVSPRWIEWAFWLLVVIVLAAGIAFVVMR